MNKVKAAIQLGMTKWNAFCQKHHLDSKKLAISLAAAVCLVSCYALSKSRDVIVKKVISTREGEFKKTKILGDPYATSSQAKEKIWAKTSKDYADAQKSLSDSLTQLNMRMVAIEGRLSGDNALAKPQQAETPEPASSPVQTNGTGSTTPLQSRPSSPEPLTIGPTHPQLNSFERHDFDLSRREKAKGPTIVSFPVDGKEVKEKAEVTLPVGSYVKAKLLTGVEAPEGTPYPVLLQLDFANILPNRKSLDLKGCFMIAKAQGDLSTERVQMQATKLSCVARDGQMFERDINGFVADAVDNSFAVIGSVNTKQDRVAAMAFLSSVVEGVGKAIQLAQTSEQTSAEGTSRRLLTGNQGKYIAAGGAGQAAGMVAQWYLKQAQNLLPTINVGSGQDIWVVMNESVALPSHYFRKQTSGDRHEQDYAFVNRLFD